MIYKAKTSLFFTSQPTPSFSTPYKRKSKQQCSSPRLFVGSPSPQARHPQPLNSSCHLRRWSRSSATRTWRPLAASVGVPPHRSGPGQDVAKAAHGRRSEQGQVMKGNEANKDKSTGTLVVTCSDEDHEIKEPLFWSDHDKVEYPNLIRKWRATRPFACRCPGENMPRHD